MSDNFFPIFQAHTSSFRDPNGFIFEMNGEIFRQVNTCYKAHYDYFLHTGLYDVLVSKKYLVPHIETNIPLPEKAYKILKPERIPFISYPYEWCFSQLKDAALVTLEIQEIALNFGMSLKDSSAFNIQFVNNKPVLIDTLSFQIHENNKPWIAYKQFCEHFLAPLALMSLTEIRLGQLFRNNIDGIPLNLANKILPFFLRLNLGLFLHLRLHAISQKKNADVYIKLEGINKKFSKKSIYGLVDNLKNTVESQMWNENDKSWDVYYSDGKIDQEYLAEKIKIVERYLIIANPSTAWDIGGNTGLFSRLASEKGIFTISSDSDFHCVEINYNMAKKNNEKNILPLFLDITNPSPSIGWANEERKSILERVKVDLIFALAIIHHLAISNNLPLSMLAEFFSKICKYLIIEFITKNDLMVKKLLGARIDIFFYYTKDDYE